MLKYLENVDRYDVGLDGGPIGKHRYRLALSDLTLDDPEGSKVKADGLLSHGASFCRMSTASCFGSRLCGAIFRLPL